jgi:hypothetical protein
MTRSWLPARQNSYVSANHDGLTAIHKVVPDASVPYFRAPDSAWSNAASAWRSKPGCGRSTGSAQMCQPLSETSCERCALAGCAHARRVAIAASQWLRCVSCSRTCTKRGTTLMFRAESNTAGAGSRCCHGHVARAVTRRPGVPPPMQSPVTESAGHSGFVEQEGAACREVRRRRSRCRRRIASIFASLDIAQLGRRATVRSCQVHRVIHTLGGLGCMVLQD